jgi:multidrug efflux pump subunit AcrB
LKRWGNQVQNVLEHTPGATYVHTDWHEDALQMGVNVREEVANRLGLTNAAISQQLAVGFEGAPVTTFGRETAAWMWFCASIPPKGRASKT